MQEINLTFDQMSTVCSRYNASTKGAWISKRDLCSLLAAINRALADDPVGTVRADDDGNVAVKLNGYTSDSWFVVRTGGRCHSHESDDYLSDWPVVYIPEESA